MDDRLLKFELTILFWVFWRKIDKTEQTQLEHNKSNAMNIQSITQTSYEER
jgi:hypothetical protein